MTELHQANDHPLNRRAKALLEEAGQKLDPDILYLAQLMKWEIDSGQVVLDHNPWNGEMRNAVEVLQGVEPENGLRFLLESDSGDQRVRNGLLNGLSPQAAAVELLDLLHPAQDQVLPNHVP